MPVDGMRATPELTRGRLLALRASVVVFVVCAVAFAVLAWRGAGSGAWAGAVGFAVAAIGQSAGLLSRRRRGTAPGTARDRRAGGA